MTNGTKPLNKAPRRQFHRYFGGTAPLDIPDFNFDSGLDMPDQNADGAPTCCTGYTVADLLTDLSGVIQDPDFAYAAALYLEGVGATTAGADFHVAMQAAVALGSLPMNGATFNAKTEGELYVANWANWTAQQKALALKLAQIGTFNALGNGDAFDSIRSCAYTNKQGVSVGTPWFPEWENIGSDGILPMPSTANLALAASNPSAFDWHNHVIKKQTTTDQPRLGDKSWQGDRYGDHGWCYFSREVLDAVMAIPGTGAIAFARTGSRWVNLIGILVQRYPALLLDLPNLLLA